MKTIQWSGLAMAAMLAVGIFLSPGCEKNDLAEQHETSQPAEPIPGGPDASSQAPNMAEYEAAGAMHNAIMDYIGNLSGFEQFTATQLDGHLANYCGVPQNDCEYHMGTIIPLSQFNKEKDFVELATDMGFSAAGVTKTDELQSLLIAMIIDPNLQQNAINSAFQNYEAGVLASSLPLNEKNALLGTAVLGRYSANYWYQASVDQNHNWHGVVADDNDRTINSTLYPTFIQEVAQDVPGISIVQIIRMSFDLYGYFSSLEETEGGIFDEHFREVAARNNAWRYSSLIY